MSSSYGVDRKMKPALYGPSQIFLSSYSCGHVLYMDNFFTSGLLVEELAMFKNLCPSNRLHWTLLRVKGVKVAKGSYVGEKVRYTCYSVFNDSKVVSLVSITEP